MNRQSTRNQIIEAADILFYHKGYEATSFADIGDAVHISRGNFYHHFKAKDEILSAVIGLRLSNTQEMLDQWENDGQSPADCIGSFIQMLIANKADLKRFGCPVGSLCSELARGNHRSQTDANRLFTLFRSWLARQFNLLGSGEKSEALAMHILARSQGVAVLTNAFHSEKFIKQEVQEMHTWVQSLIETEQ